MNGSAKIYQLVTTNPWKRTLLLNTVVLCRFPGFQCWMAPLKSSKLEDRKEAVVESSSIG